MLSTKNEILQHEHNPVWKDIVAEISIWLEQLRDNLESEDIPIELVRDLRGSAKALRNVINILPNLAELTEEEENDDGSD